jgi:hypothetical protein
MQLKLMVAFPIIKRMGNGQPRNQNVYSNHHQQQDRI